MALQIGAEAPDFTAETTEGTIDFHEFIGDGWVMLFSHPKDFTPVCTTELGYLAKIKPEFDKRKVKVIGISVDSVEDHKAWSKDVEETQGHAINYPLIGDSELAVAKLYGMLPASEEGGAEGRTEGRAGGRAVTRAPCDGGRAPRGAQGRAGSAECQGGCDDAGREAHGADLEAARPRWPAAPRG